jgi:hypothetical protein
MNRRRWLVGACCLAGALLGARPALAQPEKALAGVRSLNYWMGLAGALGRDDFFGSSHKFGQPAGGPADAQLHEVEAVPRDGVDPELLAWVDKLRPMRERLVEAEKDMKWYHHVLGAPASVVVARKEGEAHKADLEVLRLALGKRYNCTFPKFPFPDWLK